MNSSLQLGGLKYYTLVERIQASTSSTKSCNLLSKRSQGSGSFASASGTRPTCFCSAVPRHCVSSLASTSPGVQTQSKRFQTMSNSGSQFFSATTNYSSHSLITFALALSCRSWLSSSTNGDLSKTPQTGDVSALPPE